MSHSLMMNTEIVSETLDYDSVLKRLVAREVSVAFSRRESLKPCISYNVSLVYIAQNVSDLLSYL